MGKTRAECSQNAYTSHASAFLSHWIQMLANSSPKSDIKKKKKKNPTLFFRILRSVGRGQHDIFFFLALCATFKLRFGQYFQSKRITFLRLFEKSPKWNNIQLTIWYEKYGISYLPNLEFREISKTYLVLQWKKAHRCHCFLLCQLNLIFQCLLTCPNFTLLSLCFFFYS